MIYLTNPESIAFRDKKKARQRRKYSLYGPHAR
jgi:hypothetical protein